MVFAFARSTLLNSTPTTSTPSRSKTTLAAAHRCSSTSTSGRRRSASTLPPRPAFSAMNSAEAAPKAYPPIGCTNDTGQSVVTPRSNTTTGTPLWHACSTAGVSPVVVLGETISTSHFLVCSSARSFIVVRPVTRHGLLVEALEKHTCHLAPGLAYLLVSTMVGWIICSHGVAGSPWGAIRR